MVYNYILSATNIGCYLRNHPIFYRIDWSSFTSEASPSSRYKITNTVNLLSPIKLSALVAVASTHKVDKVTTKSTRTVISLCKNSTGQGLICASGTNCLSKCAACKVSTAKRICGAVCDAHV